MLNVVSNLSFSLSIKFSVVFCGAFSVYGSTKETKILPLLANVRHHTGIYNVSPMRNQLSRLRPQDKVTVVRAATASAADASVNAYPTPVKLIKSETVSSVQPQKQQLVNTGTGIYFSGPTTVGPATTASSSNNNISSSSSSAVGQAIEKRQFSVIGTSEFILPPGTIIEGGALDFGDIMELEEVQQILVPAHTTVEQLQQLTYGDEHEMDDNNDEGLMSLTTLVVQPQGCDIDEHVDDDDDDDINAAINDEDGYIRTTSVTSSNVIVEHRPSGSSHLGGSGGGDDSTTFKIELLSSSADYSINSDDAGGHAGGGGMDEDEDSRSASDRLAPYKCRHCGKLYRWKSTLRRHETVECGGKAPSYGCPYCDYKAKQHGNLGVHVRKHHPNRPQLASRRHSRKMQTSDTAQTTK